MRQTQQLHFSVAPAQFLGTTPRLPLSIIDETSAAGLICHSAGRSRLRAAAAVAVESQLMPRTEKKERGQAHEQPIDAKRGAFSVTGLLLGNKIQQGCREEQSNYLQPRGMSRLHIQLTRRDCSRRI